MASSYKVLSPLKFSGSIHGDWGYEIDGVKSDRGYVSRKAASLALHRKLEKEEASKGGE